MGDPSGDARRLTVAHVIHSGGFYGAERVVQDLALRQADRGRVLPVLIDVVDAGLKESELGRRLRHTGAVRVDALPTKRGLTFGALRAYARTLANVAPDVVHSHGYKPTVLHIVSRALRMHDTPLVVTAHGYTLTSPSLKDRLYQWLDVAMLARANAVVAVSAAMARYLAAQPAQVVSHTIPNGMDPGIRASGAHPLRAFLQANVPAFTSSGSTPVVIGSVGRLVPMKNHALLIDAVGDLIARNVPCVLVILGDGPLRGELEQRWRARMPGIEPLLIPHQHDVLDWMGDMDIFCMPSGLGEGLPMALLEAGLLERAVVCSTSGGMADLIVHRENGMLVDMGDAQAFTAAIGDLIAAPELRARLGTALRATIASDYDLATVEQRYEAVYRSVAR
jgi:glycosyltransferase involved in cell wall biosynthesis